MSRIKEIHVFQHDLPIKGPPYRMALSQVETLDSTLVEVVGENGLSGFGETCPLGPTYQPAHAKGARAALAEMAPHLIGLQAIETQNLSRRMDDALNGHAYAKAAIDIAFWDLAAKTLNMRVCDLLGGAATDVVPSYYAIGIDTPENVAKLIEEKQQQGFSRLQLKVGGRELEEDIAVVRKAFEVRDPKVRIVLDANRSLTTRDAIQLSRSCSDLDFVLEQPCDSYEEIKSLRGRVCHPVYMDESATSPRKVIRGIQDEVADGFGMKVTRVGGLSAMGTVRDICHEFRKPLTCDDSWGGDIIAAACVHMGASVNPDLLEGVWIADDYIGGNYDETNSVKVENGGIKVPTGPGLGVIPDTAQWNRVASFG